MMNCMMNKLSQMSNSLDTSANMSKIKWVIRKYFHQVSQVWKIASGPQWPHITTKPILTLWWELSRKSCCAAQWDVCPVMSLTRFSLLRRYSPLPQNQISWLTAISLYIDLFIVQNLCPRTLWDSTDLKSWRTIMFAGGQKGTKFLGTSRYLGRFCLPLQMVRHCISSGDCGWKEHVQVPGCFLRAAGTWSCTRGTSTSPATAGTLAEHLLTRTNTWDQNGS